MLSGTKIGIHSINNCSILAYSIIVPIASWATIKWYASQIPKNAVQYKWAGASSVFGYGLNFVNTKLQIDTKYW